MCVRICVTTTQVYHPSEEEDTDEASYGGEREEVPPNAQGISSNYQEKYRKVLGGLDCAQKSAVKLEPNKVFGYGETLCQFLLFLILYRYISIYIYI